jgi:hypothetical protein
MIDLAVKLFPTALAALCLVGLLGVVLQMRLLGGKVDSQQEKEQDPLSGVVAGLKWELIGLAERLSAVEASVSSVAEPKEVSSGVSVRSGMNLNKRTQALRQYRQGQPSGDIAKTLDMPKAEVDLLLKVHRIVSQ